MKIPTFLPLSALLLVPALASAQTAAADIGYVLAKKGTLPAAGVVRTEKMVSDLSEATIELKKDEQGIKGTYSHKVSASNVTEGLAPGKARWTLTSKTTEERVLLGGREELTPDEGDSLQGVAVIVEYKDGAWTAKLEEGEAEPDQKISLKELVTELTTDSEAAVYGETPHKPGDHWDVDLKTVETYAGIKSPTGSLSVEFLEVKEIGGIPCAVLKTTFDLQGDSIPSEKEKGPGMKRKMKGESLAERSLADLANMKTSLTCTFTGEGEAGEGVAMKIEGPLKVEFSATREKKP